MDEPFQAGRLAVITGGASGIGFSLAQRCINAGMHVIVCDKDQKAIDRAKGTWGQGVQAIQMDVSQPDDWTALKALVDKEHSGLVSLLALNAGIKPESSFENLSTFQTTFNTNVFGVVAGIDALLPGVKANASAGYRSTIIITGSKQGITNPPGYPAYNASKAAVKSIAEQLSYDLRNTQRVSVHLLVPGWAFTGMGNSDPVDNSTKPEGAWWPEQVVEYMEKKIIQDQFWIVCPDNEVSEALDRKRMLWSLEDTLEGRPPLSRWREEWKDAATQFVNEDGEEDTR